MITMNTMMTRGMRVVITDVAVCVLSLVKAFGAVFFLLCLLCVIVLSIFALVDRHSRYKATGKLMGKVGELTGIPTDDIEVILSVFLQQHEGRPWLDVLLHAEEDSSYRGVLRAGRIPRYVGWRVWCAGRLI